MRAIEICNLSKRYKIGTWGIQDVSFSVGYGEVVGILGPNGAGKTTLVRQITSELVPTSGDVIVGGISVRKRPSEVVWQLGVVPQEGNLFHGVTVRQHLRILGRLQGLGRRQSNKRADELIDDLRLGEHKDKPSEMLSTGLRRRLLLGIAALARPPLLVLDEPSTGLDVESRQHLWNLISNYPDHQSSVLLTTHYIEEAETLCDRIAIISNGQLTVIDTPAALRDSIDYKYKVVYRTENGLETLRGNDQDELFAKVKALGVEQYSVSRASLEDAYLSLTRSSGDGESTDDDR